MNEQAPIDESKSTDKPETEEQQLAESSVESNSKDTQEPSGCCGSCS